MYKPYLPPVVNVFPDVKTHEPLVTKFMILMIRVFGRLYLLLFLGIARIFLKGENYFFDSFDRALKGKSRCIIAFRHPYGGEPQMLSWFILFKFRGQAKRAGYSFVIPPHTVFVYGYEVVRWGGWVSRFVMPRLGAMPVHHSKLDSKGMNRIYKAIQEGPYPVSIAPEGQVSYSSESVPRLEQGAVRIGFHAAERLVRSGSEIPVEILPVSVYFRYGQWGKLVLRLLINKVEKFTGFKQKKENRNLPLKERVLRCREHALAANEKRYGIQVNTDAPFEERIDAVINEALKCAEKFLDLAEGKGEFFERMYRLRQVCWDRIFLPGVYREDLEKLTRVERGILDLRAGEAWHAGRHLELVDFSWYFRGPVPEENAPIHAKIEYVQNLWDFVNRTIGGAYANRVNIFPRRVFFKAAPPINLTERLPEYLGDRREVIQKTMDDLRDAYLKSIEEMNRE
jgi:hypothetical protein